MLQQLTYQWPAAVVAAVVAGPSLGQVHSHHRSLCLGGCEAPTVSRRLVTRLSDSGAAQHSSSSAVACGKQNHVCANMCACMHVCMYAKVCCVK